MGRPLRFMPYPVSTFEITTRCLHSRLLLTPSEELNQIVLGVIGRAQCLFPGILLHLFVVASNHIHMLATTPSANLLASFMGYVNGNIAREVGKLQSWTEKFWSRRYRAIPVLDHTALLERARYFLSHGCKEGLVKRPRDWPGANCVKALCEGLQLWGLWFDRTREYQARLQGKRFMKNEFAAPYQVKLAPLPCWEHLSRQ
jgi:REP element-mobilizing transposase RayT